jgi:hypothetical protein
VSINKLVGTSVLNFILESEDAIIAALYQEDEKPVAFITNDMKHLERYEGTGQLLMSAEDLKELVGTDVGIPLIARVFPGSALIGVEHETVDQPLPLLPSKG